MRERLNHVLNFNQRNRDQWVERMAGKVASGSRVLDVGAGEQRYRHLFAHCEYSAQDFCNYDGNERGRLDPAWSYAGIDIVSDIAEIPVEDESFDVVLSTEVLEHVPDPRKAIGEMSRVLRPGGSIFVTAPLGSGLHMMPYHYYGGFTPSFYRDVFPDCGLELVSIEPNGRFFRLLLQELARGGSLVREHRGYRRWHPMYWLTRIGLETLLPLWFDRLDDEIPVDEFTVGYHVEAVRKG